MDLNTGAQGPRCDFKMLKFNFTNLMSDAVGSEDGLTQKDIAEIRKIVPAAHKKLEEWRSSQDAIFLDSVFDDTVTSGIREKAGEIGSRFETLVVLGIGGSALGLKVLASALLEPFWNLRGRSARRQRPRLFILDNIDPETFTALLEIIKLDETCFIVVSKSGKTIETAAQFFVIQARLREKLKQKWRDHVVVVTDPKEGQLREFADKEGLSSFSIPPKLGGRFSVLSPVGLFPAACVGIDIALLLNGARQMARTCAAGDLDKNPAYQIASYHYWLDREKKKPISVMMPYLDALWPFAEWNAQLIAESLGKEGRGPTPVRALGATDQHSQLQLYIGGPRDKVITFIGTEGFRVGPTVTKIENATGSFKLLLGHDMGGILRAEEEATRRALTLAHRPNMTITIEVLDAHHIGELIMLYEIATTFAGALYGVNPFDQPGVELGKKLTMEILYETSPKNPHR